MVFHSKVFLNFKIINSIYNTMTPAIEWSESEIRALIDIRKKRNEDYYRIFGRSKVQFWNEVAEEIYEVLRSKFTGIQYREKFKHVFRECEVSKILVK